MTLKEDWTPKTADFLKKSIWVFRKCLARFIVGEMNGVEYTFAEKSSEMESIRSFAQEFSPPQSPLHLLLNEKMDFNGIDQWLSSFRN